MEPALTLRELFAGLAGHGGGEPATEPAALAGHAGLPEDLLIRAIGSYADTAPAEVAEHLSAFVAAPTDAQAGLHLLAGAPAEIHDGEVPLSDDHGFDDHGFDDHGFDDLGHLDGLGNADTLDSLDHAPVVHPAPTTDPGHDAGPDAGPDSGPDAGHDAAFGQSTADADHDAVPPSHEPLEDDPSHVSLEDLSRSALDDHDAALDLDEHHAPQESGEPDDGHHDDGHHDLGLDHFAG